MLAHVCCCRSEIPGVSVQAFAALPCQHAALCLRLLKKRTPFGSMHVVIELMTVAAVLTCCFCGTQAPAKLHICWYMHYTHSLRLSHSISIFKAVPRSVCAQRL